MPLRRFCAPSSRYDGPDQSPQLLHCLRLHRPPSRDRRAGRSGDPAVWNHENLPHCMAKGVSDQRLLKKSEFSVEEPIALIGHDGFCEGL